MPKMILIAHNKHLHSTRCGANLTFFHFVQKVIDEGKSFYIYDPPAENQPRIEEVPKFFRAYLNGKIKDIPFYEALEDVALLGANIWWTCYDRYTGGEFERMVAEMKKISEECNVDVVLWTKHYFIKKRMNITDFQREKSTIGNVEKYFDIIYAVDPVKTLKGCVVRVLKNNFGELSEHYID
ncbi:MAG: hypothetical protein IJA43_02275 [Clostridia bacterium]|nr:hypothetical protein [Clostridia bacterium]